MSLIIQIQTIAYTFLFGLYIALIFNLLYRVLFTKSVVLNLVSNFMFVALNSVLYFYLLFLIDSGRIHIYLLFIFLISFFLYNLLFKKIRWIGWKKCKVVLSLGRYGLTNLEIISIFWYDKNDRMVIIWLKRKK